VARMIPERIGCSRARAYLAFLLTEEEPETEDTERPRRRDRARREDLGGCRCRLPGWANVPSTLSRDLAGVLSRKAREGIVELRAFPEPYLGFFEPGRVKVILSDLSR
jgi:hypothetical protein